MDLREIVEAGLAPRTRKLYEKVLKGIDFEVTDESLADYLVELHEDGKAPGTLQNVLSAVQFDAQRNGKPNPAGPFTKSRMKALRRKGRSRGRGQAQGVTWGQANEVAALAASDGTLAGIRDAAIIAIGSDALLRTAEMAAIRVEDISFEDDGSARLTIPASKTDQDGADCPEMYLGPPTANRLKMWLDSAGVIEGPVFPRIFTGCKSQAAVLGDKAMRPQGFALVINRRCKAAGIEGATGHSLRVGGAQALASSGASLVEMQLAGRWTSPNQPARYAKRQLAARGATARLRYGQQ